jgi:hypothetical protein
VAKKTWRGHKFDQNTYEKLVELDKLVGPYVSIAPTQGSYSSGVEASAGTHAGGGACDLSVANLSAFQIDLVVFLARRLGLAAWHRSPSEGPWGAHIHLINKDAPDLSSGAKNQVKAYLKKLSGLASGKADKHKALGAPYESTWRSYLANWACRKLK